MTFPALRGSKGTSYVSLGKEVPQITSSCIHVFQNMTAATEYA